MSVTDDGIPHGLQGYRRFGCKCEVCMEANRKYFRDRRAGVQSRSAKNKIAKDELAAKRANRSAAMSAARKKHPSSQDDSVPKTVASPKSQPAMGQTER